MPSVAITGYTNAGKSSLLNRLTGAGVLVENALFATLDPTVRRAETPDGRTFTLTDTVGFVRHLPHQLVEAFRSTLEEVGQADLMLHVVDASDADPESQIAAVREVLGEIGAAHVPELVVLNKADLASTEALARLRRREPHSVVGLGASPARASTTSWPPSSTTCPTPESRSTSWCPTPRAASSPASTTRARSSPRTTPRTARSLRARVGPRLAADLQPIRHRVRRTQRRRALALEQRDRWKQKPHTLAPAAGRVATRLEAKDKDAARGGEWGRWSGGVRRELAAGPRRVQNSGRPASPRARRWKQSETATRSRSSDRPREPTRQP